MADENEKHGEPGFKPTLFGLYKLIMGDPFDPKSQEESINGQLRKLRERADDQERSKAWVLKLLTGLIAGMLLTIGKWVWDNIITGPGL